MSDASILYRQAAEPGTLDERQSGPGPFDQLVDAKTLEPESFRTRPFDKNNANALGVNQRLARHWRGFTIEIDGNVPNEVIPSQKGRKGFLLYVPSTAAAGIYIDSSDATLSSAGGPLGFYLPVGAAVSVPSEDGIWAVSAIANTDTLVSVMDLWG